MVNVDDWKAATRREEQKKEANYLKDLRLLATFKAQCKGSKSRLDAAQHSYETDCQSIENIEARCAKYEQGDRASSLVSFVVASTQDATVTEDYMTQATRDFMAKAKRLIELSNR